VGRAVFRRRERGGTARLLRSSYRARAIAAIVQMDR
jgi:hypothetical protein